MSFSSLVSFHTGGGGLTEDLAIAVQPAGQPFAELRDLLLSEGREGERQRSGGNPAYAETDA